MFRLYVAPHCSSKRHMSGPGHAQTTPTANLQWLDDLTEWSAKVDTEVSPVGSEQVTVSIIRLWS